MDARSPFDDSLINLVSSAYGVSYVDTARRVTFWNDTAQRISGYGREEVVGRLCFETLLCQSDDLTGVLCSQACPVGKAMELRSIVGPALVFLRHKEGRWVPLELVTAPVCDQDGEVSGGVQVFQDMTAFMEKERALTVKSQKLQTVLESIREGVLFIDTDGRVSVYNSALCELFSLRGEDLRGIEIFSLPDSHSLKQGIFRTDRAFRGPFCWELNRCPDDRASCPEHGKRYCRCWIFSLYRTEDPSSPSCIDCSAYAHVKKFLEEPKELVLGQKVVSVSSSFVEMRSTNEIWEVIVFRDVTAEKTDAVVKLAAGAAHELRQPMQVILSALSMIRSEGFPTGTTATCLDVIRESCLRMNRLLKSLGDVSRYRVKCYTEMNDILDLERSSGDPEHPQP